MSDDESFLARWSSRKRGRPTKTRDKPKPENAVGDAASEASAASLPPDETQPPFDPARLPPIGSIGAGSDIRAFLAADVPADLTRAALRRAWSADPAIRDFVGLSENSWDFNAPGGVPGFGSAKAEDIRRLLAQVMGEPEAADTTHPAGAGLSVDQATEPASESGLAAEPVRRQPGADNSSQDQLKQDHDAGAVQYDPRLRGQVNAAMQHEAGEGEYSPLLPRRRHGGALPE